MDDSYNWQGNPLFAGRDQTHPSTSSEPPAPPKRRNVPAAVGRIIGELGLRFRPAAAADLEAHAEAIRLLCEDVSDIPPHLLEIAAKRWVMESRFMPKACELIDLARSALSLETKGTDASLQQLQACCDRLNHISSGRYGWHVVGEAPNRTIAKRNEW